MFIHFYSGWSILYFRPVTLFRSSKRLPAACRPSQASLSSELYKHTYVLGILICKSYVCHNFFVQGLCVMEFAIFLILVTFLQFRILICTVHSFLIAQWAHFSSVESAQFYTINVSTIFFLLQFRKWKMRTDGRTDTACQQSFFYTSPTNSYKWNITSMLPDITAL